MIPPWWVTDKCARRISIRKRKLYTDKAKPIVAQKQMKTNTPRSFLWGRGEGIITYISPDVQSSEAPVPYCVLHA